VLSSYTILFTFTSVATSMGRVRRQIRRVKEKNPHLDAEYYEQLYADKELMPSLFRISPSTEKEVNRIWEVWKKCVLSSLQTSSVSS
jgi:hypothetical protein